MEEIRSIKIGKKKGGGESEWQEVKKKGAIKIKDK